MSTPTLPPPPPTAPDSPDDDGPAAADVEAIAERKRRRAAHAEQRRLADKLIGDWRSAQGFSVGQRRALIVLLSLFLACIAIGLLRNPTSIADPMPADAPRHAELLDRIDPNRVDVATLSALPGLGESRARAIVEYRDRTQRGDADRIVFRTVDDLMRVRGIGVALSRQMEPYLTFPATQPTSGSEH